MLDNTLVVFTYAPVGLGHIRVTNALLSGIPQGLNYIIFAPMDRSIETMYRFSSLNLPARHLMEFFQRGTPEVLYTKLYTAHLKKRTEKVFNQFCFLIRSQKSPPKKIIIIATHFDLAYQLGAIRNRLEKALDAELYMVVQVTDDSPQIAWYIDSADLIMCPSQKTKKHA